MSQTHSDPHCIFCKIVAGQIPCWKIYEDAGVLAFLDIGPLSEGHCLIIPKNHYLTLDEMGAEEAAACVRVAPTIGKAVREATGVKGWNLLQNNGAVAGQVVGHVHFHVIPRREGDGLGYRWPAGKLDAAVAQRLQGEMKKRLV